MTFVTLTRIQEMLLSIVCSRKVIASDWYYFGADGVTVTGLQKVVSKHLL